MTGNLCLTFLFYPVARGSSILPMLGLTSESSIKYHIWIGNLAVALFTAHGSTYFLYWIITNRLSEVKNSCFSPVFYFDIELYDTSPVFYFDIEFYDSGSYLFTWRVLMKWNTGIRGMWSGDRVVSGDEEKQYIWSFFELPLIIIRLG